MSRSRESNVDVALADYVSPDTTVNRFRKNRGRMLGLQISALAKHFGRDIRILDVGGRADYWFNVGFANVSRIDLLNYDAEELERDLPAGAPHGLFTRQVGDARNLENYPDASVDLVHSNSVIEHVGGWQDMRAMATELMRVGSSGWIQTPAWEFPIEPHFGLPFVHWFGGPVRRRMLGLSRKPHLRGIDLHKRREHVERINLLSRTELRALFPDRDIYVERLVFPKSYVVRWAP